MGTDEKVAQKCEALTAVADCTAPKGRESADCEPDYLTAEDRAKLGVSIEHDGPSYMATAIIAGSVVLICCLSGIYVVYFGASHAEVDRGRAPPPGRAERGRAPEDAGAADAGRPPE